MFQNRHYERTATLPRLQRRLSLFLGKSWEGRQLKLEIIQFLRSVIPVSRLCLVDHDKQDKMSRKKRLQLFVVKAVMAREIRRVRISTQVLAISALRLCPSP